MDGKRHLLLINPPPHVNAGALLHLENLGIGYLAASVRRQLGRTHHVTVWDCSLVDKTMRHVERVLSLTTPDYVGLSLTAMNAKQGLALAEIIKKHSPKTKIILGGILTAALETTELGRFRPDAIIRGEGELALNEVLTNFDSGTAQGIVEISQDTALDVDSLSWPARDMLPWQLRQHPQTSIASSRGCPYRCSFCSIPPAGHVRKWRPRDIGDVVEEMCALNHEHNTVHFYFVDDNFLLNTPASFERAERFAKLVLEKLPPIRFGFMCRSAAIDRRLFKLLKQAGLSGVFLGIESFSQHVLDRYNKKETVTEHLRAIAILNELGITINPGFIFFDPWTNAHELHETINTLKRIDFPSLQSINSKLTCYKGTDVAKHIPDIEDPEPAIGIKHYHFTDAGIKDTFELCCDIFYKILSTDQDYTAYQSLYYAMGYLQPYFINTPHERLFTTSYATCKKSWQQGDIAILQWIQDRANGQIETEAERKAILDDRAKPHWRQGNILAQQFLLFAETFFTQTIVSGSVEEARLAALAFSLPGDLLRLDSLFATLAVVGHDNQVVMAEMLTSYGGSRADSYFTALGEHGDLAAIHAAAQSAIVTGNPVLADTLKQRADRSHGEDRQKMLNEAERIASFVERQYAEYILAI